MSTKLICGVEFERSALSFENFSEENIFSNYSRATFFGVTEKIRYSHLRSVFSDLPSEITGKPLGLALLELKARGDLRYRLFLNKHGDEIYTRFKISSPSEASQRGLYCYTVDDEVVYIGRCRDTFEKRINKGYGTIYPKNCYIDGQATNCHLNSLISSAVGNGRVDLWLKNMGDPEEIANLEGRILSDLKADNRLPLWNISVPKRQKQD